MYPKDLGLSAQGHRKTPPNQRYYQKTNESKLSQSIHDQTEQNQAYQETDGTDIQDFLNTEKMVLME